jgi:hypothetical protein
MAIDPEARTLGEALGVGLDLTQLDLAVVRAARTVVADALQDLRAAFAWFVRSSLACA